MGREGTKVVALTLCLRGPCNIERHILHGAADNYNIILLTLKLQHLLLDCRTSHLDKLPTIIKQGSDLCVFKRS